MVAFMFVPSPAHWSAYVCSIFNAGSGMVLIVNTQSYVAKRTPKMIRGMIYGVMGMVTSIGIIIYLQLVRYTVCSTPGEGCWVNYKWVFGYVAAMDGLFLIIALIFIWNGTFGGQAA